MNSRAAHELSSGGPWALEYRFSSVAHRLRCLTACGIFNQGSNSCLLHWQADSLPLSRQGSPTIDFCMLILYPILKLNELSDFKSMFVNSFNCLHTQSCFCEY
ncbi:unnamed protein product [Rangifer tarandus platyrhynchus]|uniref:Uncharacterized protein n=1 Tax=Rangifer tarandus platyrhynchus TaxID=3082113 RepID=A0ABN8XTQ2_RANTA|nr:unnamed protein product [Rangifer tarandus platyrhynchus]